MPVMMMMMFSCFNGLYCTNTAINSIWGVEVGEEPGRERSRKPANERPHDQTASYQDPYIETLYDFDKNFVTGELVDDLPMINGPHTCAT